ncbi:MAG: hypothetical protein BHW07_00600 [Clostridium sp. CAG_433_25_7]|nr:MAG: hypothetical protein BHW07_00600 [Clostridium sp. CAG_433_25_7]
MNDEKNTKKTNSIMDGVYESQISNLDNIIKNVNKEIDMKLKKINIKNIKSETDIIEIMNSIEENFNIKISRYIEEIYKQDILSKKIKYEILAK